MKLNAIVGELRRAFRQHDRVNVVMSASMATNCVVDMLYAEVSGKHSVLDFGSSFDMFVDASSIVFSRVDAAKRNEIREMYANFPPRSWRATRTVDLSRGPQDVAPAMVYVGINPIVTIAKQLLNMMVKLI